MPSHTQMARYRERLAQARHLVEVEGVTDGNRVAERLGVSGRQALRYLREVGAPVTAKQQPVPWTPELEARALALLEDRVGYQEAGRTLGIDPDRIARRLPGHALTVQEKMERATIGRIYRDVL